MKVTINNKLTMEFNLNEWIAMMPKLTPYITVVNNGRLEKINLGISVKDEPEYYALATIKYETSPTAGVQAVRLTSGIGLWDFIKHLFDKTHVYDERVFIKSDLRALDTKYKLLYPYQKEAIINMSEFHNGILKARPGSGKTIMGLVLGKIKGGSILWINDRIELCKQALNTAVNKLGFDPEECGLLQGDNENVKKYTFTTIQKLNKVLNYGFNDITQVLGEFDNIIIDEAHHAIGSYNNYQQYFQVINEVKFKRLYGLTATPERVDNNEHLVYSIIGPIRYTVETQTQTMKATVFNKHCKIPTSEEMYESFVNKYTQKAMPAAVDSYLLYHPDYLEFVKPFIMTAINNYNRIIIVSPRVDGAKLWSEYLTSIKQDHFLVYGAIKKREKMYQSKIIVATLDLVKEGFDVPELECLLVIGRKPHRLISEQIVGRVERYLEGKKSPVAYFLIPDMVRNERNKKVEWLDIPLSEITK